MLSTISRCLKSIPRVAGIEILLGEDDTSWGNIVVVKRQRGRVTFVNGEYRVMSLSAILKLLPNGVPVTLSIEGKGIIHRFVDEENGADDADYLQRILPQAKYEDYYAHVLASDGQRVVSVVRRPLVDRILAEFQSAQISVLSVSLGPFSLCCFETHLPSAASGERIVGGHVLSFSDGSLHAYRYQPLVSEDKIKSVNLGGEEMSEYLLVPFAQAFMEISDIDRDQHVIATLDHTARDYRERLAFIRMGKMWLTFFIVLIGMSAAISMYYKGKTAGLSIHDDTMIQAEIDAVKKRLQNHIDVRDSLWQIDSRPWTMAYMADKIAAGLPPGAWLSELAIYPHDETRSNRERRPIHDHSCIRIRGTCTAVQLVNEWLQELRNLPFCESAEWVEYRYDDREQLGLFTIKLNLTP